MNRKLSIAATTIFLTVMTACGQIQTYESYSVSSEVEETASIGNELYRITKEEDLPNVIGKADIYGGKRIIGFTELRFLGLTPEGHIKFRLSDVDIATNETVMTRYGGTSSNGSHHEKDMATIHQLPPAIVDFTFDPGEGNLELEGVTVEILSTKPHTIRYVLHMS
jgi:hypothetical protein